MLRKMGGGETPQRTGRAGEESAPVPRWPNSPAYFPNDAQRPSDHERHLHGPPREDLLRQVPASSARRDKALELTLLIAREDPRRHPRVGARWLRRYLDESLDVTIDEAAMVAASLTALTGRAGNLPV